MLASGFLYFYVSKNKYNTYLSLLFEKFKRLIIPMIVLKTVLVMIKYLFLTKTLLSHVYTTSTIPVFNLKLFLNGLLINPDNDVNSVHLWFVYALFFIFAMVYFFRNHIYILSALSIVLYFCKVPHMFALDSIRVYLLFFCLGCILQLHIDKIIFLFTIKKLYLILFIGILVSYFLYHLGGNVAESVSVNSLLKNIVGVVVMLCLAISIHYSKNKILNQMLVFVGTYSATIYFLHTLFIRFFDFSTVSLRVDDPSALIGWIYLFVGVVFTVVGAIELDRLWISRSALLGFFLLGRKYKFQDSGIKLFLRKRKNKLQHFLHL